MQAVILAAGKGVRLGKLTAERPKGLLPIRGRSLLRRSLDCIAGAGFSETIIVTGYHADQMQTHIGDHHGDMKIRYRRNRDYDATGSMMSLLAAAPDLAAPHIAIFESDLLYHRDFARAAFEATADLMFTADTSGSGDEVYVCANRTGELTFLGKDASAEQRAASPGEFAGITVLTLAFIDRYRRTAHALMGNNDRQKHYEEVIAETARAGSPIVVQHMAGLAWTEVDTQADLNRASDSVWPEILSTGGAAPPPE
jgi:choline kinase